jgi:hypothetical protein
MDDIQEKEFQLALEQAGKLQETMATPGWKIFADSIEAKYHEAIKELIKSESPEIRQKIKAIQEVMQWPEKILTQVREARELVQKEQEEGEGKQ